LTNAAKYTDTGGHITLTVALQPEELSLSVKDTGIGLSAAAMPKLFEMFSQVDSAIDRAEGGLGIGLALVKGLVGLHGGTVEVTSAGLTRGSTFTIHLPRTVVVGQKLRANAQPAASIGSAGLGGKVLIADDNKDTADSLALVLQTSGYTVTVANSSHDALAAAMRERPDVLVLDIGLPGMTGYELARRVRQEAWGRHALLLAVTGWGHEDDKERAAAAGFDAHLTKPADTKALERLLASFFKQRHTGGGARVTEGNENERSA
jgi:CheY-like chemotaxis protein